MPKRGEKHHSARMTAADVVELRRLHYDVGLCMKCAATLVGVHPATLVGVHPATAFDAITFRTWRHVEDAATTLENRRTR